MWRYLGSTSSVYTHTRTGSKGTSSQHYCARIRTHAEGLRQGLGARARVGLGVAYIVIKEFAVKAIQKALLHLKIATQPCVPDPRSHNAHPPAHQHTQTHTAVSTEMTHLRLSHQRVYARDRTCLRACVHFAVHVPRKEVILRSKHASQHARSLACKHAHTHTHAQHARMPAACTHARGTEACLYACIHVVGMHVCGDAWVWMGVWVWLWVWAWAWA